MLVERERTSDPDHPDPVDEPGATDAVQDDGSAISWAVTPPIPLPFMDGLSDELRAELETNDTVVEFPKRERAKPD